MRWHNEVDLILNQNQIDRVTFEMEFITAAKARPTYSSMFWEIHSGGGTIKFYSS